jgi:hypothetical protein
VYNWPIFLRKFYFRKINESYKAEQDAQKKANDKSKKQKVSTPNIR